VDVRLSAAALARALPLVAAFAPDGAAADTAGQR